MRLKSQNCRRFILWGLLLIGCAAVMLYLASGLNSEAHLVGEARELLEIGPADTTIPADMHRLLQAEALLRQALERTPNGNPDTRFLLAVDLAQQGRWGEARALLETLNLQQTDHRFHFDLALNAWDAGDLGVAEALFESARRDTAHSTAALWKLTELKFFLGKKRDVLQHCQELLQLEPNDPRPWEIMGRIYMDQHHSDKAVVAYHRALAMKPQGDPNLRDLIIRLLVSMNDIQGARQQFQLLKEEVPETPQRLFMEATLLRFEGKTDEALSLIERAIGQDAAPPAQYYVLRGQLHFARREYEQSVADLERVVAVDPSHHEAHYVLSQALARLGLGDRAKAHLDIGQRLFDELVELNNLEKQAALDLTDVQVRLRIAELYEARGDVERARQWLLAAKALQRGE